MEARRIEELVRKYYGAYESKERSVVESLLAHDFTFSSPYDDRIDRRTYLEKCWPYSESIRTIRIEKLLASDNEAFVRYELASKHGDSFHNAEYLRFDDSKIREIDVYFGDLARQAGASPEASGVHFQSRQERAGKYMCLVYQEEQKLLDMPQGDLDALVADCVDWVDEVEKSGRHVCSAGLQSFRISTTIRNRNGKVSMTDGPFVETKEQLGGFTLITARDLNEALQVASKLPAARTGSVEVRPLLAFDARLTDPVDRKVGAAIRRKVTAGTG